MPIVTLIDNAGTGQRREREIEHGTTIRLFFSRVKPDDDPRRYIIQVNGRDVNGTYILNDQDVVTMTPAKIAGAARRFCRWGMPRLGAAV